VNINLNDLSFENIGMWPRSVRIGAIVIACTLLVLLTYWVDFKRQFNAMELGQAQEQKLRETYVTKQQQIADLGVTKQQLTMLAERFKDLLQQLPTKTQIPGLLEDISKAGAASGLEFTHFQPLPERQMDFYAELPINIAVAGGYHQIAEFVSQLAALDRIITLHDFSIKPYEGKRALSASPEAQPPPQTFSSKLELTILAKTYRYTGYR
jgi:type IV pilus assembly protein PilO